MAAARAHAQAKFFKLHQWDLIEKCEILTGRLVGWIVACQGSRSVYIEKVAEALVDDCLGEDFSEFF